MKIKRLRQRSSSPPPQVLVQLPSPFPILAYHFLGLRRLMFVMRGLRLLVFPSGLSLLTLCRTLRFPDGPARLASGTGSEQKQQDTY